MLALTVIHPFGKYAKGEQITDAEEIAKIQAEETAAYVVQIEIPDKATTKAP